LDHIYPQDKAKNAHGYRRTLKSVSEHNASLAETVSDPIPPLLREILSDYAATGLPPAYLPKEELPQSTTDTSKKEDTHE
jgi:hypothetical protein